MSLTSRVHTSWQLLQSSWRVLRDQPRLLVFPAVAGLCLLALALFFFAPFLLIRAGRMTPDMSAAGQGFAPAFYAWGGVVYLSAMFLATFCNVAFYHETLRALAGAAVSLRRGWRFAFSRIGAILCWSLVAGTVGLIIKLIERFGGLGRLVTGLVGTAWSVAAVFAVPVIVRRRDNNPLAVLRDSAAMLRRTWGEALVGFVGLQLGALMLLGAVLITLLATVALSLLLHVDWFPRGLFASGVLLGMIVVGALVGVATDVFRCALYVYASEGVVPQPYTAELMNAGWKVKKS